MPPDGLMEMPPESNVMPLPTKQRVGGFFPVFLRPRGALCSSTIIRGGFALPPPTARIAPIFRRLSSGTSITRTRRPTSFATFCAARASAIGVMALPGSLDRSRAMFWDSARMTPALAPARADRRSPARSMLMASVSTGRSGSFGFSR